MRRIEKRSEPDSLCTYRLQPGATFESMESEVKKDLKNSLLEEQGCVCCYCMKRISYEKMKVEHYKCQHRHPDLELAYSNLFAACDGNEGNPKSEQHCDSFKANEDLNIYLLSPVLNNLIKYKADGRIDATNEQIKSELENKLNLNQRRLIGNRKKIIDAVLTQLRAAQKDGKWRKPLLERELEKWTKRDARDKYPEFFGVAIYFIEKKLRKLG